MGIDLPATLPEFSALLAFAKRFQPLKLAYRQMNCSRAVSPAGSLTERPKEAPMTEEYTNPCKKCGDVERDKVGRCRTCFRASHAAGQAARTAAHALRPRRPLVERFFAKVNKNGPVPPHRPELGPCHIWTGALDEEGRGSIFVGPVGTFEGINSRAVRVPRVAFYLKFGRWPTPEACHHCDNPPCVRVDHLFEGTHQENMDDAMNKGRMVMPPVRSGTSNVNAKLNEEVVRYILSSSSPGIVLARELGVANAQISKVRKRQTWRHVDGLVTPVRPRIGIRGEANAQAKLTDDDVRFIRTSALSDRVLGKLLGVHGSLVFLIRHRKAWGHVS
jgi:hypothetical protein